ncbi:MAG TPA: ATP-binding protein [Nitrospiria bacterium]
MKRLLQPEAYRQYPVLYVDDEPMALETFQAQFRDEFSIHTASDAEAALAVLGGHPVAVILSDQRMPGMGGVDLLGRVKQLYPDTVRMLITAYSDMDVVIEAINRGSVYRYLTKPFNEEDLRNTIRQGIETYYLIHERERLEAEKLETAKRMERANRLAAVGTLAAGMAHEINNPLTAVSAFLQMLPQKFQEEQGDKEYWELFYQKVCQELDRIQTMISRMLRYSRFTGKDEYTFHETKLNDILEDMLTLLNPEARKKTNVFKKELAADLPSAILDSDRIRQVFMNLILNAIQATDHGTITVRSALVRDPNAEDSIKIDVCDTGGGIEQEHLPKLFDPFFTTKHHEGSGLGLLTCHQIVDAHRGHIDVRSEPGKGATFSVFVPLDPASRDRRRLERRKESDGLSA